ncbi:MAG: metallophosphoesterase [Oscillatoriales cyanobacterium C42_A2020_001]|nr:metallophosphoesterase [Leptolyngbyaceae cyanobacterium C42_A2020_001]
MNLDFRFAIISDLHIALPHTVWDHPNRIHWVEISIPALEVILERLSQLPLDFLLLPGDLTQHGEPENHAWLAGRLTKLPYPAFVIPGNHDLPQTLGETAAIAPGDFSRLYRAFGYNDSHQLYYTQQVLPGVRLIGLNSIGFDSAGNQVGRVDDTQLQWLKTVLAESSHDLNLVMIHHNIVEHLPNQAKHPLAKRYLLENAAELCTVLQQGGVQLVFTGHLHIQDIAFSHGLYDITTGSLISYPHPYRLLHYFTNQQHWLTIASERVEAVPGWTRLQQRSRRYLERRSPLFLRQLLTHPPLNLSPAEAEALIPDLRNFWSAIASGDAIFHFPHFPTAIRQYFEQYSALNQEGQPQLIDNHTTLLLKNHQ